MSEQPDKSQQQIWNSFARAIGADPRDERTIRGISGLDHPVQSVAVDEKQKRVLVISAEPSPRVAALMQVDVQATMPEVNVLVARPVIIDIGVLARRLLAPLKSNIIDLKSFSDEMDRINALPEDEKTAVHLSFFGDTLAPVTNAWKATRLPTFNQLMDVINQASYLDWPAIGSQIKDSVDGTKIDISPFLNIDNTAIDRAHGICPIPMYEFSESDWDLLTDENRIEDLRDRLVSLDIYQYFFPPPDQLALGLIDRGVTSESQVIDTVSASQNLGHILSDPEITGPLERLQDVVESLRDTGHVVEGEFGLEITRPGANIRGNLKFRPREGLVSKLLNRFSINLSASPKDFIGH